MSGPIIVWLRQDLRLHDNPALHAACADAAVLPIFIDEAEDHWARGAASRYWLHQSLASLAAALQRRGSRLLYYQGDPAAILTQLIDDTEAQAVYWNRRYEPAATARDTALKRELGERCTVRSFNGRLLFEPTAIATAGGTPYRVFTPFYRRCLHTADPGAPLPPPPRMDAPSAWPESLDLTALALEPRIDWAGGIRQCWQFGEQAALARFDDFLADALVDYPERRDYPAACAISQLSPHLAAGEISVRNIWHTVNAAAAGGQASAFENAAHTWLRQLVWREFAYHLLYHYPHTTTAPLREAFAALPWRDDSAALAAWTRGKTGIPLVDAGMRELWHTGFMHNRVRMIVAAFLCKHLGMHWLHGARWFWDTLVDADLANNTLGWQWSAGCGADAAPYFRIFNPVSQGRKFDPDGRYIRRWVAELEACDTRTIHQPGALGYCEPLVDLAEARTAALARYAQIRR